MPGAANKLIRHGYKAVEGGYGKPPSVKIVEGGNTHHQTHLSSQRAGKQSMQNMLSIGGEKHDNGPDPVKFIKKFDPQNSSGAVQKSLDIMEKLLTSTEANTLMQSIQPMMNILGGGLYSSFQQAGAAASSAAKIQKQKQQANTTSNTTPSANLDVIALLITAAMDTLTPDDMITASDLLDSNEISAITTAYYGNGIYVSAVELPAFVTAINTLIPSFRSIYGTTNSAQGPPLS